MHGAQGGVRFSQPEPISARNSGFDIRLSLSDERTFVSLGIPSYDGNTEWSFLAFDYSPLRGPVSSLNFRITDEAGRIARIAAAESDALALVWLTKLKYEAA